MSDKKAVIVIDLQKDYLWSKRKPMFSYDTDKLIGNVNSKIASYQERGYDIIYIKHILPKLMWGVGFSIKGTEGAEFFNGLDIVSDLVFEKNHSDAYSSKVFREYMNEQKYSEVSICGLDECGCVGATAKGAVKNGVRVVMIENCIGRRFPDAKVQKMRKQLSLIGVNYITESFG